MAGYIPDFSVRITTHDMHTAGEPLRIVTSGFPTLTGASVLKKRHQMKKNFDHYRKLLINEPRGHKDMYGAILLQDKVNSNRFEVIFFHNEGYSTMCGHAVIALGRYVVDFGLVQRTSPETEVNFDCPCGSVRAYVKCKDKEVTGVRFHSVPAFVFELDARLIVPGIGALVVDIAFGGAFYVFVQDEKIGLNLETSSISDLVHAASSITEAAKEQVALHHPLSEDLAFIYGTIITDGKDKAGDGPTKNICVFADKEVDRSPTGSGVTARIALQIKKGLMDLNQEKEFKSIIGTTMTGKAVEKVTMGEFSAVIVEVSGMAYHAGDHTFYLEKNDPLTEGFQLPS